MNLVLAVDGGVMKSIVMVIIMSEVLKAQYFDPGSGSYLLQILLAALLASTFFFKSTMSKMKSFLTRLVRKVFKN